MSKVTYLSRWDKSLCFQTNTSGNCLCDFNRLFYIGLPNTAHIQQSKAVEPANRDSFILQYKDRFKEKMEEGESHETLYSHYVEASQYLKWCDKNNNEAFTQNSVERYFESLLEKISLGTLKRSTYTKKLTCITVLFRDYLDLSVQWFLNIPTVGMGDREPFEAYTRNDLNQLLPFLRKLFNQTATQFIENPKKHIEAYNGVPTMTFNWQGQDYRLCGAISKMMCAATYLLSYYTYSNTGVLFDLKRPTNASTSLGEVWYCMPAFKRRAFKTIHVEMGEHEHLEVPKYCMSFFDKLLEVSNILDASEEALLLQTVANRKPQPIKNVTLQDFCKRWLEKNFTFTDQIGRQLRPVVSRFRETGAQLTAYYQGELASDITLSNTPQTRKRSYSKGNKHNNNGMMQDVASIRQEQAQNKQGAKTAQESLGIKVLTIEEEHKVHFPMLSRTPNGGSCSNPLGENSEIYSKRARSRNLLKSGEKLACADLLRCFGCPEQVVVQSVNDIWCLLSFRGCIEESLYLHLDAHHYRKNFEKIISFIDSSILPNIKKNILKQAESMLDDNFHPLWDDTESILAMIPRNTNTNLERGA